MRTADLLATLPERLVPTQAEGVSAVFRFDLSGDDGAVFDLEVVDGSARLLDLETGAPDVSVHCSADDWKLIVSGDLAPQIAFALKRLSVTGDLRLAQRLRAMFAL